MKGRVESQLPKLSLRKSFTVIIPTLQKSAVLNLVVQNCARHPLVDEVIVINNAPARIAFDDEAVKVLNQAENIFVNPAWNLGVRHARTSWLALVNDDVLFEEEALNEAAKVLRRGLFSIVGPDKTCFLEGQGKRVSHRVAPMSATTFGFGTFMCLRMSDYIPIPEEMTIWGGDDWLFLLQTRPPAVLVHTQFRTAGSVTSGLPEFSALRADHQQVCDRILLPLWYKRWWHRPVEVLGVFRRARYDLRERLKDFSAIAHRG